MFMPLASSLHGKHVRRHAVRRARHIEEAGSSTCSPAPRRTVRDPRSRTRGRARSSRAGRSRSVVAHRGARPCRIGAVVGGVDRGVERVERAVVDLAMDVVPALGRVVEAVRRLVEARHGLAGVQRIGIGRGRRRAVDRLPGHRQRREVVIERAVLLHDEDHVIDRDLVARGQIAQGEARLVAGAEPARRAAVIGRVDAIGDDVVAAAGAHPDGDRDHAGASQPAIHDGYIRRAWGRKREPRGRWPCDCDHAKSSQGVAAGPILVLGSRLGAPGRADGAEP